MVRYLRSQAAAEYLGVSMPSLRQRIVRRSIPFIKENGRLTFDKLALDEYMKTHRVRTRIQEKQDARDKAGDAQAGGQ